MRPLLGRNARLAELEARIDAKGDTEADREGTLRLFVDRARASPARNLDGTSRVVMRDDLVDVSRFRA